MNKRKNITIYDIAREAGVSPATVSRVLTGNATVRPETKKKIIKVIDKYNFRPSSLARSLLYKQTQMIGFVLPDINHPFFSTLVLTSETHALRRGYTSFLCNSMNDTQMESEYLQNLLDKQVDGIIFLGGRINALEPSEKIINEMQEVVNRVPTVFINGEMPGVDAHIVHTDEKQGIHDLVQHLVEQGHTKIGLIGGYPGISSTELKREAFTKALEEFSLDVKEEWMIQGGFSIESGEENVEDLFELDQKPTALICINDFVAVGVVKQLNKKGFKVPEDFSVVGFDDIYLAQHFPPGITTISQNYDALGEKAIDVLVNLIDGKKTARETVIPTELVVRNSTRNVKDS